MEASTTGINFTGATTVSGVSVANTTQLATKQDTLVSGTNIKTINGTTVLGSGNIVTPQPSGVSGAIQFSNGSAFASDATNFFWDNTNKRLGVITNAPAYPLDVSGKIRTNTNGVNIYGNTTDATIYLNSTQGSEISYSGNGFSAVGGYNIIGGNTTIGATVYRNGDTNLGARLGIRGSGSTSATTSLLVQNSAGSTNLRVSDNGSVSMGDPTASGGIGTFEFYQYWRFLSAGASIVGCYKSQQGFSVDGSRMCINVASGSHSESASFQIDSTTRGMLMPRKTTTQINAIASPATGLEVYNTTLECPCFYDGTAWRKVSHTTM
jgi:hypothetical protein